MTPRPPADPSDALSPEERALAARLSALDPGGPSPAVDARILAAARHAAPPPAVVPPGAPAAGPARRGRPRRWPTALGAAATFVVAVGLAWQLKPLLDMPEPLRAPPAEGPATEAEVLAQVEPATPRATTTEAAVDAADPTPAPAAPARNALRRPARRAVAAPPADAMASAPGPDYFDEAIGDPEPAAPPPAPPAPPPAAAVAAPAAAAAPERSAERSAAVPQAARRAAVLEPRSAGATSAAPEASGLDEITVSGTRMFPPVAADASLAPVDWMERIRARRDAGQVEDARASLRRFVREHPRQRLPDDLRRLLLEPR